MIKENFTKEKRSLKTEEIASDLVIVGGGLAGTCCAITAARQGVNVVLVQDRPVLGGNGSSEIRLWILGATSHMGNNNRWAREGGVVDEILLENLYRNPEGNPLILDTILIEKVTALPNITLLLNTAMYDLEKKGPNEIEYVWAFCSQNSTQYKLKAPLFVDGSGDGIMSFMAGAAFRMGAESADEFDEAFAPDHQYGELLGHSLYFYSKDTGKPVRFVAPQYANTEIDELPRFKSFNLKDHGCRLWWVEYGGRKDTIHESETIKWELWRVIYGIWNHLKNSGEYPEVNTHTLEWVGTIPGKRESRRFEGDYILSQKDLVEQRVFEDAISFGGWALDLHPADGVYGEKPGCTQWHTKGVYQIPYRTMYSKNISNLFLTGRIISASHVAFGSSRVMATCAHNAQAVAMAAVLCKEHEICPSEILKEGRVEVLKDRLVLQGQYIPNHVLRLKEDLAQDAKISTSSTMQLLGLSFDGPWKSLTFAAAQMLPLVPGKLPAMKFQFNATENTKIVVSLLKSEKEGNFSPEIILVEKEFELTLGEQYLTIDLQVNIGKTEYYFVAFSANEKVSIRSSQTRATGLLTVFQKFNKAVATTSRQEPPKGIGIEAFDFWLPERRPEGHNFAFELSTPIDPYSIECLTNGVFRPTVGTNAWAAALNDTHPCIEMIWDKVQNISSLNIYFDTDFDHALESTLMGHPESEIPFCVKDFKISDGRENVLAEIKDNHQTVVTIKFKTPVQTDKLLLTFKQQNVHVPVALFGIVCL
ncbi:FAD-dependent oxidoreductase [Cyclobacterium sp. 1_MG-2023]|uniref:FAD-dependent oxidoreductase n=1 Tax=Cyclobacterium sp. 1_MG-2023 TaxID=3062681 RepID=UPI0026E48928|nr:FAD-dependent oxidoreductase [Cyclobacterium sp. 1_MG-2023]MDO6438933.1 FAD-dependent oxidoreductase [Cyclobacterium sp. 1_MG-2023]